MDPKIYEPYTRKMYPKTFQRWGTTGVKRIDAYRRKAALLAARNPRCDVVELSELSEIRSVSPSKIIVFVDCKNGERFYLSNEELDTDEPAQSNRQRTEKIRDSDAIQQCSQAIQNALRFPSSMSKSWFSTSVYRAPQGNVVVTFNFTAQNGFGATLPQKARCVFDGTGNVSPEITNR